MTPPPLKTLLIWAPETRYQRMNTLMYLAKPSLMQLYSYLQDQGLPVEILDLEVELGRPRDEEARRLFARDARALIARRDFDVAAISCFFTGAYLSSLEIAKMCRELRPRSTIVVGGYHPTAVAEDFTRPGSPVDFVVRGEGERFLASVARREAVRGKSVRLVEGQALDLSRRVPMAWNGVLTPGLEPTIGNIAVSRGCPYQCAFCMEPTALGSPRWRAYSVEDSLAMVDELVHTWKLSGVFFCDPLFGAVKPWRRAFLKALAKKRLPQIFFIETRVDLLEPEDLDLLSGIESFIFLGVETGSAEMLRRMHKTGNPKQYLEKVEKILTHPTARRLFFQIALLFNHPGETPETVQETLRFFEGLIPRLRHNVTISPSQFVFYPGNPLFASIGEYERLYGTKISDKRWWTRRVEDQALLARSVVASRELERAFDGRLDYWQEPSQGLRMRFIDRLDAHGKMASAVWRTSLDADHASWERHLAGRRVSR